MTTNIEWCKNLDGSKGETWNFLTGCDHCSDGCDNCWAQRMATRLVGMGNKNYRGSVKGGKWTGKIRLLPDALDKPLHWKKPRRIFVQSMGDLFHQGVPFEFIDKVFATMVLCSQHTFMILTKRPERMYEYMADRERIFAFFTRKHGAEVIHKGSCDSVYLIVQETDPTHEIDLIWPLPNVHLYTSIDDQVTADERVEWLLKTPAVVHGLSIEPMLGPVDLWGAIEGRTVMGVCPTCYNSIGCTCDIPWRGIDHVIVGGESGPGARPMHPDWVMSVRDQCVEAGVKFFFKQWGEWSPYVECVNTETRKIETRCLPDGGMRRLGKRAAGRVLDGRTWDEMP